MKPKKNPRGIHERKCGGIPKEIFNDTGVQECIFKRYFESSKRKGVVLMVKTLPLEKFYILGTTSPLTEITKNPTVAVFSANGLPAGIPAEIIPGNPVRICYL